MKPENILVTGGAGFIGSNFVRFVLQQNAEMRVINLDALTYAGHPENLEGLSQFQNHIFVQGDIANSLLLEELFREYGIDTVIHFAAETHVDRSIASPEAFLNANVMGTFCLLETARKVWLAEKTPGIQDVRFHHISTDEVFGTLNKEDDPFSEKTPYAPRSPYAASKAASDHFVNAYAATFGLPVTISNCSNNYGPWQFPEKLIPLMILNAMQGKPLPVYGDGMQVRDWLYVDDHCEAIWKIILEGRAGETYCIGGGNQKPNIEIVTLICQLLDEYLPQSPHCPHAKLMIHVSDRPGHDRRYDIDFSKISTELGWQPKHSLPEGLRKTVKWYLENSDWLEAMTQKADYRKWMQKNYSER